MAPHTVSIKVAAPFALPLDERINGSAHASVIIAYVRRHSSRKSRVKRPCFNAFLLPRGAKPMHPHNDGRLTHANFRIPILPKNFGFVVLWSLSSV